MLHSFDSELPENSSVQVGVSQRSVLTVLLLTAGRPRKLAALTR